ncbi:hypothetical protein BGX29_011552 [Mortierella sp. GBA35]|nr:hypothetical protein BGX29_011552 [Mortierella sp. GBA35]
MSSLPVSKGASSSRLKSPSVSSESEDKAVADNRSPVVDGSNSSPFMTFSSAKEDVAEVNAANNETVDAFGRLNQPTSWEAEGIDMLATFNAFIARRSTTQFVEHEYVADLSENSPFLESLSSAEFAVALSCQPTRPSLDDHWPTSSTILDRVLAPNSTYDATYLAAKKESMLDPIAEYIHSVLYSYGTYLQVERSLPQTLNEREAFADITWPIIRGALRLTGIASRYLEVPIQGVDERKNGHKDLRTESKVHTLFADGVGLLDGKQAYLAEASVLFNPDPRKRHSDEYKLKRGLRDTLISQIKHFSQESIPPNGMSVFGSTSYADKTKFYRMDFCGAFRLTQIGAMTVPTTSSNFGGRMKRCLAASLEFAILIQEEQTRRSGAQDATMRERHEFARACTRIARTTASPQSKNKKSIE